MSGPVGAMTRRLDSDRVLTNGPAEVRADPTWSEAASANWRLAQDDAEDFNYLNQLQGFGAVADELVRLGYPRARYRQRAGAAPRIPVVSDYLEWAAGPQKTEVSGSYQDRVWQDLQAERRKNPKSFADIPAKSRAEFDSWTFSRRGARARDQATAAQGGTGTMILPSLAFGLSRAGDAENLPFIALGGSGRTFAGTLAKQFGAGVIGSAVIAPQTARSRINMGEGYSSDELLFDLGIGGVAQAGFVAAPALVGKAGQAAYDKFVPRDYRMARALKAAVPREVRPPELNAALNVIERAGEIDMSSPYQWTDLNLDHHTQRIEATIADLAALPAPTRLVAPVAARPAVGGGGGYDPAQLKQLIAGPESGGDDGVTNRMGSSASGRYQFVEGTFKQLYARVYGGDANAAWNGQRFDVAVQERLMDRLMADNAAALRQAGVPVDNGNMYVLHVLGSGNGPKLLRAGSEVPVASLLSAQIVAQNPTYFGGGRTVAEALDVIRGKVGGAPQGAAAALPPIPPAPIVRPDALDAVRPMVTIRGVEVPIVRLSPSEIGVDAPLMQFKSGGDEFGVTEALRGVTQWDDSKSHLVTAWQRSDGSLWIADGYQRLGLAKRIMAGDPAHDIRLNAMVLREEDGFSPRDARTITALMNIAEGSGKPLDVAKVFRDLGVARTEAELKTLPVSRQEIKDGRAMLNLSPEAFGAVWNGVVPEGHAAAIGQLAPDPATHMALIDLLAATDPPNRAQAESIIRQALDAGFSREQQVELFGTRDLVTALYAQKAKALDRTLAELRKLKGAFGVAARNADALDAAGNLIDVGASEQAAAANGRALALIDALALRKGNAVNDLFNRAAERLGNGEKIDRVVKDLVAELGQLDLAAIARGTDVAGEVRGADDFGRADEPGVNEFGADRQSEGAGPDLSPATLDELEAAGQGGFALFDEAAHQAFDDPGGAGVKLAADSAWHDIRAEQEITRKAAETAALGEKSSPEEIGALFDLDDGKGARSIADIEAELKADESGIDAIRGCLL